MDYQLELPGPHRRTTPGPVDAYYTPNGGKLGYTNLAHACASVPLAMRSDGLTVLVTGLGEYWWRAADFSNAGLKPKQSGAPSGAPLVGATVRQWEPDTYADDLVLVVHNFTLFQLTAEDRPFVSQDIDQELEYGLWTPICCENNGQEPTDPGLYLLTEDGRRITDENGQPITID